MFTKYLSPTATSLDKAIAASVAAMLAMNLFVLAQQFQDAPRLAAAPSAQPGEQA